ncbi:uncharacterized protein [Leptinotarsa decemlineata]|uniref:uncharacterized protein n=1 Tax=Leptinotarsa decemlineata TaxID=7539 RepID=UPI003D30433A
MHKFLFLAVFLFASLYATAWNNKILGEDEIIEMAIVSFEDLMKLIDMSKDKCPDIEKKLETTSNEIEACIREVKLGSNTLCSFVRKSWKKCTKIGIDAVSGCLPAEAKNIPRLLVNIIWAVVDQACRSTFEETLELFNPCAFTKGSNTTECTEIKQDLRSHRQKLPSTNFVCSFIPKVRSCVEIHEAPCKNPITKQAALHYLDAVEKTSKDDCESLNEA